MSPRTVIAALCLFPLSFGLLRAADEPAPFELSDEVREKCLKVLRGGLASDEFWPAMHAAEGLTLGGYGDEVVAALVPKVPDEKDDQRRCGLARELVRAGKTEHAQLMLDILAGENDYGHVHAAESLFKVKQFGDGQALRRAFRQEENVRLRLMAAGALARMNGNRRAFAFLRSKLGDADPDTSRTAAWILGQLGDNTDIDRISALVPGAPDAFTRSYYEHSLAALGDPAGMAALEKNLSVDDGPIRTYAANFAAEAHAAQLKDKLIAMLDDPHLDARVRAAQALVQFAHEAKAKK